MATVRLIRNFLEGKIDTFNIDKRITVEQLIREHTTGSEYSGATCECYDMDTGETFYAAIEDSGDSTMAVVAVNGEIAQKDYLIGLNDIVCVAITPSSGDGWSMSWNWDWGRAIAGSLGGSFTGMFAGMFVGSVLFPGIGTALGGAIGGIIGGLAAGIAFGGMELEFDASSNSTATKGLETESLPDVRGSQNQPLTGNPIPVIIGKHLATPFIAGSAYNEISGEHGETNYIHALYCVGYSPLRITDIKIGDIFLAHNQSWNGNEYLENVFHGKLYGTDGDKGEIVNTWSSNDITVEILQQHQDISKAVDYGNIYPYSRIQQDIGANVLYIMDDALEENDIVAYKGAGLANGLRNNVVRFTEQYPLKITVELDFPQGLYRTWTEKDDDNSYVWYGTMPVDIAIQWRVYSDSNIASDGKYSGEGSEPEYDYVKKSYKSDVRPWHSFKTINSKISAAAYSEELNKKDAEAHTGNHIKKKTVEYTKLVKEAYTNVECGQKVYYPAEYETVTTTEAEGTYNPGWWGAEYFPLDGLSVSGRADKIDDQAGINEFRCVTSANLWEWAKENLAADGDTEQVLIEKFKAYFFGPSNTTKSVEVRLVRLSPNYLDETKSTSDKGATSFSDVFKWTSLTTEPLDADRLNSKTPSVEQKRPLSEERLRKMCLIAVSAKTDNTDQLSSTLKKLTCTAQSFSPYYDKEMRKWVPENVLKKTRYYRPNSSDGEWGDEITKEEFESDRLLGTKSIKYAAGNDFTENIVENVIMTSEHIDSSGRYYIPKLSEADKTILYCGNNVASMFILSGIGAHAGRDAMEYIQSKYEENGTGDFDLMSLAEWYKWAEEVTDGSTYSSDGYHYTHDGNYVLHNAGDIVQIYFAANAYIYQQTQLKSMMSSIAVAGRASYIRDQWNRLKVIVDKPEKYPVALLSQRNILKTSGTISYSEMPSGLQMSYPDENDGYISNTLYCMADGESSDNPRGDIEQYSLKYVTNNCQAWSLGRYLLGYRLLNRESVTNQTGPEGESIEFGDLVLLQSDNMLLGTDTGGRITKVLEDDSKIYGFLIDSTYRYTGEAEIVQKDGKVTREISQGVLVMQPSKSGASRVVTLRLASAGASFSDSDGTYILRKGATNLVLFGEPVSKTGATADGGDVYVYEPHIDDLVGFGKISSMTETCRVVGVKQDADRKFTFTLMKYTDELYNYGDALPSFQNSMTVPDRSGEDSVSLDPSMTAADKITAATADIQNSLSIYNVTQHYLISDSSSGVTKDTDGWTTESIVPTVDKQYLWMYTTYVYKSGAEIETSPVVIGMYSSDGREIFLLEQYYIASEAGDNSPGTGEGWTEAVPPLSAEKPYLWSFARVTYSSGRVVETEPVLAGTWSEEKGTASVKEHYLAVSLESGITLDSKDNYAWSDSFQPVSVEKIYLWNYKTVTYSDGTTEETEPEIIGKYGANAGYMDCLFAVGDFGLADDEARLLNWQRTSPEVPDGKCLYIATKWIET